MPRHESVKSFFVDGVKPFSVFLEFRSDNKSICELEIRAKVFVGNARAKKDGQGCGGFGISQVGKLRSIACGSSRDYDRIPFHEFDRMGDFPDADIGGDGVGAVLLFDIRPDGN